MKEENNEKMMPCTESTQMINQIIATKGSAL